ncbi:hypothetical protein MYIN104542_28980 [Mycobacterium intermedium]
MKRINGIGADAGSVTEILEIFKGGVVNEPVEMLGMCIGGMVS